MLFFGFCLLFLSCKKEQDITAKDNSGVFTRRPHIWQQSTTDDGTFSEVRTIATLINYNDGVLIGARKNGKRVLRMVDLKDGQTRWDWADFIEERSYLGARFASQKDNLFFWQAAYWNYCIDLSNGKTVWKNAFTNDYDVKSTGIGDKYFGQYYYGATPANKPKEGGYSVVFNTQNGLPYQYIRPRYDTTGRAPFELTQSNGIVHFTVPLIKGQDTLLLLTFIDPFLPDYQYRECYALYNLTQQKWIYDRADYLGVTRSNINFYPIIYIDKIYSVYSYGVLCHDLMTGVKKWQTDVGSSAGFGFGGIIIEENRLYANSNDGYLYCFDLETGGLNWKIRSSGSSTKMSYLNGVIYFVGGGDGKLHAVEAATGKYLWQLDSPDKAANKNAYFKSGLCAVVPGKNGAKGKIVVLTGLNAYCYEAER